MDVETMKTGFWLCLGFVGALAALWVAWVLLAAICDSAGDGI
jgi:hypothetical protein